MIVMEHYPTQKFLLASIYALSGDAMFSKRNIILFITHSREVKYNEKNYSIGMQSIGVCHHLVSRMDR